MQPPSPGLDIDSPSARLRVRIECGVGLACTACVSSIAQARVGLRDRYAHQRGTHWQRSAEASQRVRSRISALTRPLYPPLRPDEALFSSRVSGTGDPAAVPANSPTWGRSSSGSRVRWTVVGDEDPLMTRASGPAPPVAAQMGGRGRSAVSSASSSPSSSQPSTATGSSSDADTSPRSRRRGRITVTDADASHDHPSLRAASASSSSSLAVATATTGSRIESSTTASWTGSGSVTARAGAGRSASTPMPAPAPAPVPPAEVASSTVRQEGGTPPWAPAAWDRGGLSNRSAAAAAPRLGTQHLARSGPGFDASSGAPRLAATSAVVVSRGQSTVISDRLDGRGSASDDHDLDDRRQTHQSSTSQVLGNGIPAGVTAALAQRQRQHDLLEYAHRLQHQDKYPRAAALATPRAVRMMVATPAPTGSHSHAGSLATVMLAATVAGPGTRDDPGLPRNAGAVLAAREPSFLRGQLKPDRPAASAIRGAVGTQNHSESPEQSLDMQDGAAASQSMSRMGLQDAMSEASTLTTPRIGVHAVGLIRERERAASSPPRESSTSSRELPGPRGARKASTEREPLVPTDSAAELSATSRRQADGSSLPQSLTRKAIDALQRASAPPVDSSDANAVAATDDFQSPASADGAAARLSAPGSPRGAVSSSSSSSDSLAPASTVSVSAGAAQLQWQIDGLRSALRMSQQALLHELSKWEAERTRLEARVREAEDAAARAVAEVDQRVQASTAVEYVRSLEAERDSALAQLGESQSEVRRLTDELTRTQHSSVSGGDAESASRSALEAERRASEAQARVDLLRVQLSERTAELAEARRRIDALEDGLHQRSVAKPVDASPDSVARLEELQAAYDEAVAARLRTQAELEASQQHAQLLEAQVSSLGSERDSLQAELSAARTEADQAIDEAEAQLRLASEAAMRERVASERVAVEAARADAAEQRATALATDLAAVTSGADAERSAVAFLERSLVDSEARGQALSAAREAAAAELVAITNAMRVVEESLVQAESAREAAAASAHAEAAARAEAEQAATELADALERARAEARTTADDLTAARAARDAAEEALESVQAEVETLRVRVVELERILDDERSVARDASERAELASQSAADARGECEALYARVELESQAARSAAQRADESVAAVDAAERARIAAEEALTEAWREASLAREAVRAMAARGEEVGAREASLRLECEALRAEARAAREHAIAASASRESIEAEVEELESRLARSRAAADGSLIGPRAAITEAALESARAECEQLRRAASTAEAEAAESELRASEALDAVAASVSILRRALGEQAPSRDTERLDWDRGAPPGTTSESRADAWPLPAGWDELFIADEDAPFSSATSTSRHAATTSPSSSSSRSLAGSGNDMWMAPSTPPAAAPGMSTRGRDGRRGRWAFVFGATGEVRFRNRPKRLAPGWVRVESAALGASSPRARGSDLSADTAPSEPEAERWADASPSDADGASISPRAMLSTRGRTPSNLATVAEDDNESESATTESSESSPEQRKRAPRGSRILPGTARMPVVRLDTGAMEDATLADATGLVSGDSDDGSSSQSSGSNVGAVSLVYWYWDPARAVSDHDSKSGLTDSREVGKPGATPFESTYFWPDGGAEDPSVADDHDSHGVGDSTTRGTHPTGAAWRAMGTVSEVAAVARRLRDRVERLTAELAAARAAAEDFALMAARSDTERARAAAAAESAEAHVSELEARVAHAEARIVTLAEDLARSESARNAAADAVAESARALEVAAQRTAAEIAEVRREASSAREQHATVAAQAEARLLDALARAAADRSRSVEADEEKARLSSELAQVRAQALRLQQALAQLLDAPEEAHPLHHIAALAGNYDRGTRFSGTPTARTSQPLLREGRSVGRRGRASMSAPTSRAASPRLDPEWQRRAHRVGHPSPSAAAAAARDETDLEVPRLSSSTDSSPHASRQRLKPRSREPSHDGLLAAPPNIESPSPQQAALAADDAVQHSPVSEAALAEVAQILQHSSTPSTPHGSPNASLESATERQPDPDYGETHTPPPDALEPAAVALSTPWQAVDGTPAPRSTVPLPLSSLATTVDAWPATAAVVEDTPGSASSMQSSPRGASLLPDTPLTNVSADSGTDARTPDLVGSSAQDVDVVAPEPRAGDTVPRRRRHASRSDSTDQPLEHAAPDASSHEDASLDAVDPRSLLGRRSLPLQRSHSEGRAMPDAAAIVGLLAVAPRRGASLNQLQQAPRTSSPPPSSPPPRSHDTLSSAGSPLSEPLIRQLHPSGVTVADRLLESRTRRQRHDEATGAAAQSDDERSSPTTSNPLEERRRRPRSPSYMAPTAASLQRSPHAAERRDQAAAAAAAGSTTRSQRGRGSTMRGNRAQRGRS